MQPEHAPAEVERPVGAQNFAPAATTTAPAQATAPKAPEDPQMADMILWRRVVVGFIIFTSITIVIILQVLM